MFKHMTQFAAIGTAVAAGVLTVGATTPAAAASDFGHHVSTCAQTMGFSGDHNPGIHQGRHGWGPTHPC